MMVFIPKKTKKILEKFGLYNRSVAKIMQISFTIPIISILLFVLSCSTSPKKTYVVVTFDVEDYTTPASYGLDEIPKWLAEVMTEVGVTGTFFVIGEKARSFEKRKRSDVIDAISNHDIGSHTNFGSIHPTVTEILENADWNDGENKMTDHESQGFRELERIFDKPITTLARHGGSYGPQLIYALGKMGAGYVGSPINLPGKNVVWYCNALNFYGQYDGFDNIYYRDDLFEPQFNSLKLEFPKRIQNVDVISFFAGHPCKIRTEQFWDFNYYYGANPDSNSWKTPQMRSLESMKTAKKNFRRLMQYLKEQENIEMTTFNSLIKLYSKQKERMSNKELVEIASKTIHEKKIYISDHFSPAEAFSGIVKSIFAYQNKGVLPQEIKRDTLLGPIEMPSSEPEISRITLKDVYNLANKTNQYIKESGCLPSYLDVQNHKIGTGALFALFCSVYLDMNFNKLAAEYVVNSFEPYPTIHEQEIIKRVNGFKTWPVHRRDLDMSHLVELTKLQFWTLKPAYIM